MNQLHQQYFDKMHEMKALYQKYGFSTVLEELNRDIEDIYGFQGNGAACRLFQHWQKLIVQ